MAYYIIKTLITVLIIVIASEISKKSSLIGAIIISLPLTSIKYFLFIYLIKKYGYSI
tara:strand:- start:6046 stop:6216 length:171 start_codon:yes stop_codon:yes gene_type:complete